MNGLPATHDIRQNVSNLSGNLSFYPRWTNSYTPTWPASLGPALKTHPGAGIPPARPPCFAQREPIPLEVQGLEYQLVAANPQEPQGIPARMNLIHHADQNIPRSRRRVRSFGCSMGGEKRPCHPRWTH